MQKGTVRLASRTQGSWTTSLVGNQDFMRAGKAPLGPGGAMVSVEAESMGEMPDTIRIPGTIHYARRSR